MEKRYRLLVLPICSTGPGTDSPSATNRNSRPAGGLHHGQERDRRGEGVGGNIQENQLELRPIGFQSHAEQANANAAAHGALLGQGGPAHMLV